MNCSAVISRGDVESMDDWEDFVCLSRRHEDDSMIIRIKDINRSNITTWYAVSKSTTMEQIFNSYTEIKGIDDEAYSMKYKFHGYEICRNDTVESIGIVEYDVIECYEIAPPPSSDASTDSEACSDETTIADETDGSSNSDNDHGEEDGEVSNTTDSSSNNKRRKVSIDCQQSPKFHNGKYLKTMKQVIKDSTDTKAGIDNHAQGLINMYPDKIDGVLNELPFLLNFISPILLDILTSTGDNSSFHAEHMIRQLIFRLVVGESVCKFDKASQYGTYIRVINTTVGEFKDYVSTLCSDELADHPKGASLIHIILAEIESYPDELPFSRIYVGETSSQTIEVRRCQENNPTVKDGADMQWEFFQLMWGLVGEPFHIQISQYEPHDKVLAWKLEALVATLIVAFSNRTCNIAGVEHHRKIRLTCHDGSGLNVINCGSPIWLENNDWSALFKDREGGIKLGGNKKMKARVKLCSSEGCTSGAVTRGVCIKHGGKKECKHEGCTNQARKGGVCMKHGAKIIRCSSDGCTNQAKKGGVCWRHGAKKELLKRCSSEGCTKYAQKGGVCIRHGAKKELKRCSSEGCTNKAQKGGVCIKHGARKECKHEGCTNHAQRGGEECASSMAQDRDKAPKKEDTAPLSKVKQGKKGARKRCSNEGCTNIALNGRVCMKNGAKKKQCSSEGCTNIAVRGGVCKRHGAKVEVKRCSFEGCTKYAQRGGVCIKHGAKVKRCSSKGCTNKARKGGVCIKHGAKVKLCNSEGCTNQALKGGVCVKHGAKRKRCSSEGCTNQAQKGGVCRSHGAKIKYKL